MRRTPNVTMSLRFLILALVWISFTAASHAIADDFRIVFRGPDVITASFETDSIAWSTVSETGQLTRTPVQVSNIRRLDLARTPSGDKFVGVRKLAARLASEDWKQREIAEQELIQSGGPFISLLERYLEHPSLEVRHRIKRVMSKVGKTKQSVVELDTLTLRDGRVLQGEAVNFSMTCRYRDQQLEIDRGNTLRLLSADTLQNPAGLDHDPRAPVAATPIETTIYHDHRDFDHGDLRIFEFETDSNDNLFADRAKLDDAFADDGLLLADANPGGYVGVSVFSFKYEGLPVGGRSVCLYNGPRNRTQFVGVMEIRFCVPGQADSPAGVHEFGVFVARVKHSRDIVVEGYDVDGNVLATVEATDQQCVFAGIKSNRLISRVRVFSNPWLGSLKRNVDRDYAIDSLRMTAPQPLPSPTKQSPSLVVMRNGDRISGQSILIEPDGSCRAAGTKQIGTSKTISFQTSECSAIHFRPEATDTAGVHAMLTDGSVVAVRPDSGFTAPLLDRQLSDDEAIGFWHAQEKARFPLEGDLDDGTEGLVVYPTGRVRVNDLRLGLQVASWTPAEKLQQKTILGREDKADAEDPVPADDTLTWQDDQPDQPTTLWRSSAKSPNAVAGIVRLTDGQRLVFGPRQTWRRLQLEQGTGELRDAQSKTISVPLSNIASIIFPPQ